MSMDRSELKLRLCLAILSAWLHRNGICPGNHNLSYDRGWFTVDTQGAFRRPSYTRRAEELLKAENPEALVRFCSEWNTYVLTSEGADLCRDIIWAP